MPILKENFPFQQQDQCSIQQLELALILQPQTPKVENPPSGKPASSVEIQINRIRLPRSMQALSLDPAKLKKAIERARRMGITPSIRRAPLRRWLHFD
jgi:hypothetical protein